MMTMMKIIVFLTKLPNSFCPFVASVDLTITVVVWPLPIIYKEVA